MGFTSSARGPARRAARGGLARLHGRNRCGRGGFSGRTDRRHVAPGIPRGPDSQSNAVRLPGARDQDPGLRQPGGSRTAPRDAPWRRLHGGRLRLVLGARHGARDSASRRRTAGLGLPVAITRLRFWSGGRVARLRLGDERCLRVWPFGHGRRQPTPDEAGLHRLVFHGRAGDRRGDAVQRALPRAGSRSRARIADGSVVRGLLGHCAWIECSLPAPFDLPVGRSNSAASRCVDGNVQTGHGVPSLRHGRLPRLGAGWADNRERPPDGALRPDPRRDGDVVVRSIQHAGR